MELARGKKKSWESTQMELNKKLQKVENLRKQLDIENNRFENLRIMDSNILASENDWAAVQCIPDLCTAAANLMKDLEKEFPESETMTNVEINCQQFLFGKLSINKSFDQDAKKATFKSPYLKSFCYSATGSNDGHIVISGCRPRSYTAFTVVVDVNGTIMMLKEINTGIIIPEVFCDFISQHKVVLAYYERNTISLYDICDGSYFEKVISDASSWPARRNVKCVATDPVNSHILVGGYNSRDVYVFDDELNYLHILTLPTMIEWPRDITVSDGYLLVCDYDGKKSYITTMKGLESNVVREFMKPDVDVDNLRPRSVCTDQDGFVYMLWKHAITEEQKYVVQYIHDGSQVLRARQVNYDANVVTTVETAEGEKVVVVTRRSCKMYSSLTSLKKTEVFIK